MKASPPTWRGCDSDRPTTIQPFGLGTTGNAGGDADSARSGRLIPLEDLLDRPVQSFIGSRREGLLGYYAQVWALALLLADQKGLIGMALNKCSKTPPTVDSAGK